MWHNKISLDSWLINTVVFGTLTLPTWMSKLTSLGCLQLVCNNSTELQHLWFQDSRYISMESVLKWLMNWIVSCTFCMTCKWDNKIKSWSSEKELELIWEAGQMVHKVLEQPQEKHNNFCLLVQQVPPLIFIHNTYNARSLYNGWWIQIIGELRLQDPPLIILYPSASSPKR
jgi:hypothetical protein